MATRRVPQALRQRAKAGDLDAGPSSGSLKAALSVRSNVVVAAPHLDTQIPIGIQRLQPITSLCLVLVVEIKGRKPNYRACDLEIGRHRLLDDVGRHHTILPVNGVRG